MQQNIINNNEYESESESDLYSEYDSEEEYIDIIYFSEEPSVTRFNIALCELYNEIIHGKPINYDLNNHYLLIYRFKQLNIDFINSEIDNYSLDLHRWLQIPLDQSNQLIHPTIRNYRNIVFKIKPEIVECIYLNTNECVSIIKTIWIKLIQRTWKKIYKDRQSILKKRCNIFSLKYREINGKWPKVCKTMPTISGMLSYLSH